VRSIATGFAVLATGLLLAGCSGKPRNQGTVQPDSGGRGGNSMLVIQDSIQLYFDDETLAPSMRVGMSVNGARITVAPADGSAIPPWLVISPVTKSGDYSASVTVTFAPQSELPHSHELTLRFAISDNDGSHVVYEDVPVSAIRLHRVTPARQLITYATGMPATLTTRLELVSDRRWVAQVMEPWLHLPTLVGTGSAALDVSIDAGTLPPGEHFGSIVFSEPFSRRTKYFWVLLIVDPRRLETGQRGLGFSATLGATRLTRELRIIDTAELAGRWRIADDAAWLSASASTGAGSSVVTLTADPTALADGLHFATLTVSPDNEPGFDNSSGVRIAFHVDRSAPPNGSTPMQGAAPSGALAADPIRPWLYGFDRNGTDSTLRVWNFHTGALLQSLTVPNLSVARARVAPDGRMLLVTDIDNRKFVAFPLDSVVSTPLTPWTGMRFAGRFEDFGFAHLNGRDAIAWSAGQLLSADDGSVLAGFRDFPPLWAPTLPAPLSVSADGRFACMAGVAGTSQYLTRLSFFVFGNRSGTWSAIDAGGWDIGSESTDCVSDSNSRNHFVTIDGELRRYPYFGITHDRLRSTAQGDRLQLLSNGELYLSGGDANWKHVDPALESLGSRVVPGDRLRGLVSGDESRIFELVTTGSQATGTFRDRDF
jgi:hypothetical protein